jgi:Ca2+:H+ antiporter
MSGLDLIKREARKEAWYGDSYNPFRKVTKANTWASPPSPTGTDRDVEAGEGGLDDRPISAVASEPIRHSHQFSSEDRVARNSKDQEYRMTKPKGVHGRSSAPESGTTVVDTQSTRPPSEEEKARRRFVGKFFRRDKSSSKNSSKESDDADKSEKRPWYKGKVLKHEPFTVRNQISRTILNSWINLLLIAAPVGIGLNYAGVDGKIIFVVNFIAIIPLASMLSFATEEIALYVGESLGGLLNASFG